MRYILLLLFIPVLFLQGFDLQAELNAAQPGDTLTIPPGVYTGEYTSAGAGYTVNADGAHIVGSLTITGADQTWDGIEVSQSWTTRSFTNTASLPLSEGLTISAPRTTVRNCYIHDTRVGVGFWEAAPDSTLEGCLIANNGYMLGSTGHGHGLYVQNNTGRKLIRNNVIIGGYSAYAIHAYGQAGRLNGLRFENNVNVGHLLIGGSQPIRGLQFVGNVAYGGQTNIGYGNMSNVDALIQGNTFLTTADISGFSTLTVTGNLFQNAYAVKLRRPAGAVTAIDDNFYTCHLASCPWQFAVDNNYGLATWRAAGFDGNSSVVTGIYGPGWVAIKGRIIVIHNPRNKPSVQVDTGGLAAGQYRLVNALNTGESLAFTAGAPITLPLSGWTVATPQAGAAPLRAWDSKFSVWIVEPLTG
jgi:hypothetical protein